MTQFSAWPSSRFSSDRLISRTIKKSADPAADSPTIAIIPAGMEVVVLAQFGPWIEVGWMMLSGPQRGWLEVQSLTLGEPVPADRITPTPGG